ncbi:hypothetical protein OAG07_03090 [Verrucomicrobia bacterium]|nr:hypothetical protein [Verrucomicrobiota bacterium]
MEDDKSRNTGHSDELIAFRGCNAYCLFHPRELRDTDVHVHNPYCVLKQSGCLVMIMTASNRVRVQSKEDFCMP